MVINIKISNKVAYTAIAILVLVAIAGLGYAYNSLYNDPAVMGHSIDEIEGLQQMIKDEIATANNGGNMCRLCRSCGGEWGIESGSRLTAGDWGPWLTYGDSCSGEYKNYGTSAPVKLCCK
jgi:hypothetical protein